jgi:glycosyltransferase involved in cell wall biosynthesis
VARVVRIQSRICVGGPALNSILLTQGLSHKNGSHYDTTLLGGALEPGESSMEPFAAERGVTVETIPEMGRAVHPRNDALALYKVTQRIRALRPQIVHTHTAKAGAIGRTAARIAGTPIVVHTFHGHIFEGYFHPAKAQAFIQTERALARMADVILALSEQQRFDLAYKYRIAPAEKIRLMPLGLELDRFKAIDRAERGALRQELGLHAAAPLVVAVGRLVPIKRFDLLIEAFQRVLREVPGAHLAIAGDGATDERAKLERLAAGNPNIHFLGWRKDLEKIYAAADALCLTSDNEGTPVTVIEALSSGLPVVATRVGGVEDVVSAESGLLVAPGDVDGIARSLITLLRSKRTLADTARHQVAARYSHRRLIRDMAALYDSLLAVKAPAHAVREATAC